MARKTSQDGRLSLGVSGIDEMVGGGLLPGDATLVAGSPGTGKTTLGLHFLAAGVAAGEPGVMVSFEYLPQQIYRDAKKKGMPLQEWEDEGKIKLVCTSPQLLLTETGETGTLLDTLIREIDAKRVVIDSMTHFEMIGRREDGDLRANISGLMNHLRMMGVTTFLTHEVPQIIGPAVVLSNYGLEFLVDNIFVLRYVELEGELSKAINVLKFRGGRHDRRYRLLELTEKGAVVQADFQGVEGISSGSATRSAAERLKRMV